MFSFQLTDLLKNKMKETLRDFKVLSYFLNALYFFLVTDRIKMRILRKNYQKESNFSDPQGPGFDGQIDTMC